MSCSMHTFTNLLQHSIEMKIIMKNGTINPLGNYIWRKSFYNLLHIWLILSGSVDHITHSLTYCRKMNGFPFWLAFSPFRVNIVKIQFGYRYYWIVRFNQVAYPIFVCLIFISASGANWFRNGIQFKCFIWNEKWEC